MTDSSDAFDSPSFAATADGVRRDARARASDGATAPGSVTGDGARGEEANRPGVGGATSVLDVQEAVRTDDRESGGTVLRASGVGKRVSGPDEELTILQDVDTAVERGEAVAIVGPSGSGKSTLLGILAGLDMPSEGTVSLLGQDLATLDEDGRARLRAGRVGFVFQNFQLLPGLSALENVMLPIELTGGEDAAERARAMLGDVGLGHRATHHPLQLSGGEQQRVALARAFVSQPALLFADEPTGNLDSDTGGRVIELMFSLRERLGSALVLVTHDDTLAARCDRRLRMDGGRLEAL